MKFISRLIIGILFFIYACNNIKVMKEKTYKINYETDFGQFYIVNDISVPINFDWDKRAFENRMYQCKGCLAVLIASTYFIQGEVIVLNKDNGIDDINKYDHIVEGGIEVINKHLYFLDCPNSELLMKIELPNGHYGIRVYTMNSKNILGDCLEPEEDRYKIEIFPSNVKEIRVIKMLKKD